MCKMDLNTINHLNLNGTKDYNHFKVLFGDG